MEVWLDMDGIMERTALASKERDDRICHWNEILTENHRWQDVFEKEYHDLSVFIAKRSKAMDQPITSAVDDVVSMLSSVVGDGHRYMGKSTAAIGSSTDLSEDGKQLE